jgi:hypothetical protein
LFQRSKCPDPCVGTKIATNRRSRTTCEGDAGPPAGWITGSS